MKPARLLIIASVLGLMACRSQQVPAFREVYSDRFATIDSVFWEKAAHTFENNLAYFNPANAGTDGRGLRLEVTGQSAQEKRFSAAELRSRQSFKFGKFTIRMKAAPQEGVVSAFFLYSPENRRNKEIDIEFTGKNSSVVHLNHWVDERSNAKSIPLGFDAAQGYHDYSIIWLPGEIRWAVDGKEIYRVKKRVPNVPLQLMMNIWPSKANDWAGRLSAGTLPAELSVEYVKVYSMY